MEVHYTWKVAVVGGEGSGNREEHSESLKQHVQGSWGRWIWSMQGKMSLRWWERAERSQKCKNVMYFFSKKKKKNLHLLWWLSGKESAC